MAIKSDGTLWGWGSNLDGKIGDGTSGRNAVKRRYPVPGPEGNDWKHVAAGGTHSCAINHDGTLWSWGDNWTGQLGIGTTKDTEQPVQVGSGTNSSRPTPTGWMFALDTFPFSPSKLMALCVPGDGMQAFTQEHRSNH